ncbi:MAG TPA: Lon-like protease helical domain-containing protein [Chitinispirillaceae bacterium]|nr:Lon-like protease helical domain-containing protein [Chitinispirillaceae bacterium]
MKFTFQKKFHPAPLTTDILSLGDIMSGLYDELELKPQDTEPSINFSRLDFNSTAELESLEDIIGQDRAVRALELGLGINDTGYNIYMAGSSGMGKKALGKRMVIQKAKDDPTPDDWIYVNNFSQEDRPLAIALAPGKALAFKKEMEDLISRLKDDVPRAFRQEDFSKEKQRLNMQYENQGKEVFSKLEKIASDKNLIIQEMPDGRILMIPKKGERPMNSDEFDALSQHEKDDIAKNQSEVGQIVSSVFNQQREISQKLRDEGVAVFGYSWFLQMIL